MWPTPTTGDGSTENLDPWLKRRERKLKEGINLHKPLRIAVKMHPTPLSRDYKDTLSMKPSKRRYLIDSVREDLTSKVNGTLNPMWVEWLMGYPIGWTDLRD